MNYDKILQIDLDNLPNSLIHQNSSKRIVADYGEFTVQIFQINRMGGQDDFDDIVLK
jgi:hypothetical protein